MLMNVRICALFKEMLESDVDDDESSGGHIFIGLGRKAGDMYHTHDKKIKSKWSIKQMNVLVLLKRP